MALQTSLNPPLDCPFWARCTGCMVAIASFPGFLVVSSISGAVPWQIGFIAAGLSVRGLTILTCPRVESFWHSIMRAAEVLKSNRRPDENRSGETGGPQGTAGSQSIASGTKTAA